MGKRMPPRSTASRVYFVLIGLMLILAGGTFTALMARSYLRARAVEAWPVVPCTILQSEAEERQVDPNGPVERRFAVLYGYVWQGHPRESDRLSLRGNPWSSREAPVLDLVARYPAGSRQECRVNPDDPTQAVLKLESKAPGYSIWFPLIFVAGGIGVIGGACRR
jgi:hypothetical protein